MKNLLNNLKKSYLLFRRPKIALKEINDDEKIEKLIKYFVNKEAGLINRIKSARRILDACIKAGFYPIENFQENSQSNFSQKRQNTDLIGMVKTSIREKINILTKNSTMKIDKTEFKLLLDEVNHNLTNYCKYVCKFDPDTSITRNFLRDFTNEINIKNAIMKTNQNQIIVTQIISKTYLEIIAYVLAWLYFIWCGAWTEEQYYYPPWHE